MPYDLITSAPEDVGLSSERLARLDRRYQESWIDAGRLTGVLTLVHRRGQTVHFSALGQADRERGRPMKGDDIFRIYSMTKPITSIAFMMLVEQGKVMLDDPVHRLIPEWKDLGVYAGGLEGRFLTRRTARAMQMVDLLRHTSGLTYGLQQRTNVDAVYRARDYGVPGGKATLEGMISGLAELPLEFSPGDAWNYSVSTDVLGYLVGKISGVPFERFVQEQILDPLGMDETGFHVPTAHAARLAACYSAGPDGKARLSDDPEQSPYLKPPGFVSGGGGLVSTAADYLKFARMLLNGGELNGHRLVSPKTLALMTTNSLPGGRDLGSMSVSLFSEATYQGVGFGLGFAMTLDPSRTLLPESAGNFYWGGAAGTYFWVDPVEELICIFMTQLLGYGPDLRRELKTMVYSAITESYA
jgi:CubicO group peptidase (beta-lactamase class C family)